MSLAKVRMFIAAILVCQLAGLLGNIATLPNIPTWYAGIAKPAFNPPNWVFGPVWTTLYLMMGIALFLIWQTKPHTPGRKAALTWFFIQLGLNTLWSFLFFGLHSPLLGLIDIVLLWLAIVIDIRHFVPLSKAAAGLLVPYWLWVTFAMILNFEIFRLNS